MLSIIAAVLVSQPYSGGYAISVDPDHVISCVAASGSAGGCLTSGTQEISGFKYINQGFAAMAESYFNGPIVAYPYGQLAFGGYKRWDDLGAGIRFYEVVRRDGGVIVEIDCGPDHADECVTITGDRQINVSGTIVDATQFSGNVSMRAMPRYNLNFQGGAEANHTATALADGGLCLDQSDHLLEPDGGCYIPFEAPHGEVTTISFAPRSGGGWLHEFANRGSDTLRNKFAGKVAFVDIWGGIGTMNDLHRNEFPECPGEIRAMNNGQQTYIRGALVSTRLWAADEERYYVCASSGWYAASARPDGGP